MLLVRRLVVLLVVVFVAGLTGCIFDEPPIEDRWTRVDMESPQFFPGTPLSPGVRCSVEVRTKITYRAIVTGFSVTELRASAMPLALGLEAPREAMASQIDALLAGSVSTGRFVKPVTGWHHLIQPFDAGFTASVPGALDSTMGGTPGGAVYLYLVSYLGSGEEIELPDGSDSIAVTPFQSTAMQILPVGMNVPLAGGPIP